MVGKIFAVMSIISLIFGSIFGNMQEVSTAAVNGAADAVQFSISMLGLLCLWSGIIRILDKVGITNAIARVITPVFKYIYPSAYKRGVSFNNLSVNFSANLFGLGNAALPSGIRSVKDLSTGTSVANDDLIMFSVLNTTPLQLIPTTLIAIRTTFGSQNPFEIIVPIWICSVATTISGILICKLFSKFCRGEKDR